MAEEVIVAREGRTLIVTVNRPHVRNAIDRATALAIATAMDELDDDPGLVIGILTGAGGNFSAGIAADGRVGARRSHLRRHRRAGATDRHRDRQGDDHRDRHARFRYVSP